MKISELEGDQKSKTTDDIDAAGELLGLDSWSSYNRSNSQSWLDEFVGICSTCKRLSWSRKEFGGIIAVCNSFETKLSGKERMVECNEHERIGTLSLSGMWEIATLIDTPRRQAGFTSK